MPTQLPVLLMTRPLPAAKRFVQELRGSGMPDFRPVFSPLLRIEQVGNLPDMAPDHGVIFSSANGIDAYTSQGGRTDIKARCVGQRSAAKARALGLDVSGVANTADALVDGLISEKPRGPFLHVRGVHSRGNVAKRLSDKGIMTDEAILYDQVAQGLSAEAQDALSSGVPVVAPLFSPRTAEIFGGLAQKTALLVAVMSEAVAKPLASLHIEQLEVAKNPDSYHMAALVKQLLLRATELVQDLKEP